MNLSFIKLDIDIMNDTKIKIIRKMPSGNDILVVWIGVLCLAMKSGRTGVLEIGDGIPFNDELLSAELDIDIQVMRLALKTFENLRMIEYFDNGEIYITNFEKHQNIEKIESSKEKHRIAQQSYRDRQKMLSSRDYHVKNSDATDKEEEKDKEKEKKYNEKHEGLAVILGSHILHRDPKNRNLTKNYDKTIASWAEDIRKLNEIDGRELEEIKNIINWSQNNIFWCNNILSANKLRKQFDKLYLQSKQNNNTSSQKPLDNITRALRNDFNKGHNKIKRNSSGKAYIKDRFEFPWQVEVNDDADSVDWEQFYNVLYKTYKSKEHTLKYG